MKKMIMVLVLVLMSTVVFAGNAFTLPEIMDPAMIEVKNDKLYVLQRTEIFIYSIKDKKLIKKFGREGEGPGEFMINPYGAPMSLNVQGEKLIINSTNKISYFSLDGKYLSETPAPPNTVFVPMKGEYLGIGAAVSPGKQQPQIAFRIFDEKFNPHTALYFSDIKVGNLRSISLPMEALHYIPLYKGKLYIVNSREGFVIDCLDLKGKKLYSIKKKYEKIKVSSEYKQHVKEWFKTDPNFKRIWDIIKPGLTYEDYYRAIGELIINNDILYAFTHKKKDDLSQCVLLDLKGKELGRVYLPMPESDPYTYYPKPHAIENNRYYFLKENDDEEWELRMETILKK